MLKQRALAHMNQSRVTDSNRTRAHALAPARAHTHTRSSKTAAHTSLSA